MNTGTLFRAPACKHLSMHATKPDAAPLRGKCSSGTRLSTRTDFWACSTPG
nr:MAG TPA: hypothetical protein [Caudoviricetes sp.]DAU31551.1 MAG TPA: hypothetical protein [Caudoviricetes sp.]